MRGFYYALVGIMDDARYLRFLFWRGVMRACAWADIRLMRLHTTAHLRAARLDRRIGGG